jgi:hypothetical protein
MSCANMQPSDATQKIIKAPSMIGRRPNRSESGPSASWNTADASM